MATHDFSPTRINNVASCHLLITAFTGNAAGLLRLQELSIIVRSVRAPRYCTDTVLVLVG
jgi:hypothetical protein